MTIVANDSITVSNINDGTITHTAYSYSADGTDRFTTVYPNLNLLDGTKDFKPRSAGNNTPNQNTGEIYFTQNKTVADLFKAGDYITISYDIEFLNTDLYSSSENVFTQIQMYGGGFTWLSQVKAKNIDGKFYTRDTFKSSVYVENPTHKVTVSRTIQLTQDFITANATVNRVHYLYNFIPVGANTNLTNLKIEPAKDLNSIATPYMPSASEVTTADWPSYIGQYTDFTQADSTNPSDYTWSLIRGNDGKDGKDGKNGTNGTDGDPGKIVSETEPTTRFKGLTWKYSGTTDLTASDGTVIHPNTEYYYNGTHWMINYFSVNNFAAESITSDKIDGKNLTITDGEFVSTTTNGPVITSTEIKDNHIAISKTDGTVNTRNDIALDSEQGLAQKFTNINTGFYRTAGINYQGPFTSDSDGNYAQLTPQGTKLSTDVPWTTLAATGGFSGSIQFAIQNGIAFFSLTQVLTPKMTAEAWYQIAQLPSGSKAIPSINRVTTAFANTAVWGFYVSTSGGLYLQSKTALNTPGSTSANTIASFPIG